ncbi:hypothetical protein [Brevibacillus sp. 179-C9.3 HS]|uniref:hypothetical protein n=1 Tax=unclassified Brevibacillus TaxID=2684853 RepID=UPI0039A0DFD3
MQKLKTTLAMLVAATMLSSTPVWAKDVEDSKLPNHVKETYEEVLDSVPQLKEYEQLAIKNKESKYLIGLEKKGGNSYPNAWIEIDKENGELISFVHTANVERSTNAPSDELAKEKASAFLEELLDDKFDRLEIKAVLEREITVEYEDAEGKDSEVNRNMKLVLFRSTFIRDMAYSVVVDTNGEIYSFTDEMNIDLDEEDVNPKVQQGVKRLLEVVPRLKEEKYEIKRNDRTSLKEYKSPKSSLFRDEIRYASENFTFTISNITGELLHLSIGGEREKSNNPIAKEVAKVKAAQFIQQMMKDSENYDFIGIAQTISNNEDDTTVGFKTPLVEDNDYVKHLRVYVDDNGNIAGVRTEVEESTFDFEEFYYLLETEIVEE